MSSKNENLWFELVVVFDKNRNQVIFEIVLDDLVGALLDYNDFDVNLAFDDDQYFSNHLRDAVRNLLKQDTLEYRSQNARSYY